MNKYTSFPLIFTFFLWLVPPTFFGWLHILYVVDIDDPVTFWNALKFYFSHMKENKLKTKFWISNLCAFIFYSFTIIFFTWFLHKTHLGVWCLALMLRDEFVNTKTLCADNGIIISYIMAWFVMTGFCVCVRADDAQMQDKQSTCQMWCCCWCCTVELTNIT